MCRRPVAEPRKSSLLLASTSVAALLIGGGAPPALAAPCVHVVTAAFDNPAAHTTANVCVRNTSFTGNITNEGTISPSGIAFANGTITGFVQSTGVINGGISLDTTSRISGAATGIAISGPAFTGAISNAGSISGSALGIIVQGVTSFGGGIVNNGNISSPGAGILLQVSTFSGGISLGSAGTITAGGNGIEIDGPGTFLGGITNAGLISSSGVGNSGIRISGTLASFGGGITNTGTISAANGVGIEAVPSAFSGGITNVGTVSAKATGILVFVSTFAGGISNAGTISSRSVTGVEITGTSTFTGGITNSGTVTAHVNAIGVISVGTFTSGISNSGTLAATTQDGILLNTISTFAGGITNTGTITAGASGIASFNHSVQSWLGGITNAGSGTITAHATGIFIDATTFAGGVTNAGSIAANVGIKATNVATFANGIVNAGTGTITAAATGILVASVSNFSGGVTNAGAITAANSGIAIGSNLTVISTFAGGLTNSGTISAGGSGMFAFKVSTFSGGITNSGTISATNWGLYAQSIAGFSGGILNSGTISAGATNGLAIVTVSTFAGGVTNVGTITAATHGIFVNNVAQFASGGVTNTGSISAKIGVDVTGDGTFAGGILNATPGRITAARTGIALDNVADFTGGVLNAGSITTTTKYGVIIANVSTFAGGFTNTGTITANSSGVHVANVVTFLGGMTNSGTISSAAGSGMSVFTVTTFSGGMTNSGTISSLGWGMYAQTVAGFSGGMLNSGTITAARSYGVAVIGVSTFAGGVTNTGTITAATDGIYVNNVAAFVSGGVTNSGSISAKIGVDVTGDGNFVGGIVNAAPGLITAGATGIALVGVSNFSGGVTNAGTITPATKFGILIGTVSTFAGGVTNAGSISAHVGIEATAVGSLSNGILNAATGRITSAATGIMLVNVANFAGGVTNAGAITSTGSFGIKIFDDSLFAGGFTNSGHITAHSTGVFIGDTPTVAGGITNTGTISSANASGVAAFMISTFSGGITNTGTISAGGGWGMYAQSVAGFSGDMVNTGTVTALQHGLALVSVSTFAGGITNIGHVTATGTGIYVNSVGTLAGGITNTGTVSGAHGIFAFVSTSVSLFDSGTIIGTSGNAVTFGTGPNTLTLGPGYNIVGDVVGSGTDIFQLGGSGSGNFDLATIGSVAQYRGFTTFNVVGGVWNSTGTFAQSQAWNVLGGTLAGTGTFQSINVASGGTLAPGTPGVAGTFMTATGNLAFSPGAIYAVQLSPTAASRINVTGAVTLNGQVQGFLAPGAYAAKTTYNILDPSSMTGTFTGFTAENAPGFTGTLTYDTPTDVLLTLTMNMGLAGMNGNQQNVATAINNTFNNGGTLPAGFFPLTTLSGANLGNALMQIDGEAATGATHSAFQSMTSFLNLMIDPFVDGRDGWGSGTTASGFAPERPASLPPAVALAYASVLKAPPAPTAPRWNAWAAAYGGSSTADGNAVVGSSNITAQTFGYASGIDYHVSPDTLLGFALAGGGTSWGLAQALGGGRSDAFQAGVYGKTLLGPAYLAADFGFANHWFTTNRTAFAGDQLTARFDGQSYGGRFEAGWRFGVLPRFGITPYAALQAQSFHTPSYSETDLTGGGFGLAYNAMSATDTRSELGARFDDWQIFGGMPLVVRGRIAWAHDWVGNPALTAVFESLPGASFVVTGAAIPKDSALTSIGAEWKLDTGWSLGAKFDGEFAAGAQTYAGTGVLRYTW